RRELRPPQQQPKAGPPQHILVAFGGADPKNVAPKVLHGLIGLGKEFRARLQIRVVVGPMATNQSEVKLLASEGGLRVEVIESASRMDAIYRWTDLAIVAPGTTALELAAFGVPQLNVVVAENQHRNARGLQAAGASEFLGSSEEVVTEAMTSALSALLLDPDRCQLMSERARSIVDGQGAKRVV